jgi:hydroxymethylglutaryl-CoA synthase
MEAVGIDDISIYFPKLHFEIEAFAAYRNMDFSKLNKGLGLESMSIPDAHEDAATMGANACVRLLERNQLSPKDIGRIYLGTESALDGAKPTATYIIEMLEQKYGPGSFGHCDVTDITFACIGGIDAMHNTLDWVARGGSKENRQGIVVFSDDAKYSLNSPGEYTQGAGAGAALLKHNPRLLEIEDTWGVSTHPAHDFFKPKRKTTLKNMVQEVLDLAKEAGTSFADDLVDEIVKIIPESSKKDKLLFEEKVLTIHKDTPVFDGQLSNRCYTDAVKKAFIDFRANAIKSGRFNPETEDIITEQWSRIIVHLPYAFQGKRMFPDVFMMDRSNTKLGDAITEQIGEDPSKDETKMANLSASEQEKLKNGYRKLISKTAEYQKFTADKIEKTQKASSLVGNQYTASIFLALMSTLEIDVKEGTDLRGKKIGFCAYGSGAKSKVFQGIVQKEWTAIAKRFNLFERLEVRTAIDASTYEALHRGYQLESITKPSGEFILQSVGGSDVLEGHRKYTWVD